MATPTQFPLDMQAETQSRAQQPEPQNLNIGTATSQEIAAKIGELMRQQGIDGEANPMAAEKIQRDLEYQRQMETFPQPDSAPPVLSETTPELDRLETLQRDLEVAQAETKRWKKEFGRREGTVGQMRRELGELKAQVTQMQPAVNVQQITGKQPDDPITAQDAVNLLMSQSSAFGNAMNALREQLLAQTSRDPNEPALPFEMEAELVDAHPWLSDLTRPQKMRAMQDILANAGVTVTPQAPVSIQSAQRQPATLPDAARAPIRQIAYIEPSNRGSASERNAIAPERQAYAEKIAKYREALARPGGSEEASKILASLGAGPVDETQMGFIHNRR